ncbi:MAG: diguanylate cyclase [Desulfotignum sp.]
MEIPPHLMELLKENEEIAEKFNEIEISILNILNFQDFLEKLLFEIGDKFSLPYIWICIITESPIAAQLKNLDNSALLKTATAFVSRQQFVAVTKNRFTPLLANTHLDRYTALVPKSVDWDIGSIAIAPITLDGDIVGSINQADPDKNRFAPDIDASLLERLAVKVSLCLSNVTAHERLRYMAYHDPLTGLLNRRVMERILEREFVRASRYEIQLTLLFLDLDDFKTINDTHGHDMGDKALCHVAGCLSRLKRDSDVVARFAGDEFVVILPSTSRSQAEHFMDRVKNMLAAAPVSGNGSHFYLSLSHGVCCNQEPGIHSAKTMLTIADKSLYQAKLLKKSAEKHFS